MYFVFFFFFNDTATTEIYTLSLHDALPISYGCRVLGRDAPQLSSRRRSCPTRHNQRYARADVGTVGGHLVLWGGLLEAVTAAGAAGGPPSWGPNPLGRGALMTTPPRSGGLERRAA